MTKFLAILTFGLVNAGILQQKFGDHGHDVETSTSSGQTTITLSNTPYVDWTYQDTKTGSKVDFSAWVGLYRQGYLNTYNHPQPYSYTPISSYTQMLFTTAKDSKGNAVFAAPTDYSPIWSDSKSGGSYDTICWALVCPNGYVSMSDVFSKNTRSKPALSEYSCISENVVTKVTSTEVSWTDKGSGAKDSLTVYSYVGPEQFKRMRCYNSSNGAGGTDKNAFYYLNSYSF